MNYSKQFSVIGLIFYCSSLIALSSEENFIRGHRADDNLVLLLDKHSDELASYVKKSFSSFGKKKHGVWQFDWLPGYYVKYDISRIHKRDILARSIDTQKLTLLHAPKKMLYHIKGRPHRLHNINYAVIIEEVKAHKNANAEPLSLPHVEQFIRLIEDTGHISTYASNYIRREDGSISFIDTDGTFDKARAIIGLVRLLDKDLETYYTPEAVAFILTRIAQLMVRAPKPRKQEALKLFDTMMAGQKPHVAKAVRAHLAELMEKVK